MPLRKAKIKNSVMKLYFDNIIYSWQRTGGISVVWTELLKRVVKSTLDYSFIEFDGRYNNALRKGIELPKERIEYRESAFTLFDRYFPIYVKNNSKFIFHSSYYRTCKSKSAVNIITVHDFTYERYRSGIRRIIHTLSKGYAIKKSDHIICISQSTKRDLLHFFPNTDEKKIHVVYNGVSDKFKILGGNERYRETDTPFLLFVGSRKGYKNFNIAVECAKEARIRLVITGSKLDKEETIYVRSHIGDNYEELGFIDEEALNRLYNKAFALIYPSSYEGFGLPVIEAQRAGCPVLALNSSSIPEIIGYCDFLVEKEDVKAFAQKIDMFRNVDFRRNIIDRGLKNSERFSWDRMFEEYMKIYSLCEQK